MKTPRQTAVLKECNANIWDWNATYLRVNIRPSDCKRFILLPAIPLAVKIFSFSSHFLFCDNLVKRMVSITFDLT